MDVETIANSVPVLAGCVLGAFASKYIPQKYSPGAMLLELFCRTASRIQGHYFSDCILRENSRNHESAAQNMR